MPAASTMPRFVRKRGGLRDLLQAEDAGAGIAGALPMKLANGDGRDELAERAAGAIALKVRLEATVACDVTSSASACLAAGVERVDSRTPFDESPSAPTPNQFRTMSSSAMVAPAAIEIVRLLDRRRIAAAGVEASAGS